jgi:hypothetical protein
VGDCIVCCWQPATRKGHSNACRLFVLRHGRDKELVELQRAGSERFDKAFGLHDWC